MLKNVEFSNTVPASIDSVFADGDPIAYAGACAAEKTYYKFVNKVTGKETEEFPSARDAANWLSDLDQLGYGDSSEWERISYKKTGSVAMAIALTRSVLNDYRSIVPNASVFEGYLTERGVSKSKDVAGLENRYQANRTAESPTHLDACRDWLVKQGFKVLKGGFEADAIVISKAERQREKGLILSIDKDLQQAEGTFMVNMKDAKDKRVFCRTVDENGVGAVWYDKAKKKWLGMGFRWLLLQAMSGDRSDGYFGLNGVGAVTAAELLGQYHTKEDLLKAMVEFYISKVGEEYTYTSWDEQVITLPAHKLMEQHIWLAYQERSPNDEFRLSDYIKV